MLKLKDVHTFYGPIEALKGVSMEVGEGEIVSLIGPNGAGKSTTLNTISGVLRPAAGKIEFMGSSIQRLPSHRIVEMGICQVPEGRRIFPGLTVMENLEMGAYTRAGARGKPACAPAYRPSGAGRWPHADRGQGARETIKEDTERLFAYFPILKERLKQLGGTLSGGEQQMLAIARALMSRPKLLLLDEPSLGLAPIMVDKIFEIIKRVNEEGVTILLVEQNANLALSLSHKGYVMETGKVVMHDDARLLLKNPRVREAYLGG